MLLIDEVDMDEVFCDSVEFEELEVEFCKMEVDGFFVVDWKMLNVKMVDVL